MWTPLHGKGKLSSSKATLVLREELSICLPMRYYDPSCLAFIASFPFVSNFILFRILGYKQHKHIVL